VGQDVGQDVAQEPGAGGEPATGGWRGLADRRLAQAFALGALAGCVLLGLVWVAVSVGADDPPSAGVRANGLGRLDQRPAAASAAPGPTRLQRCASVAEALAVPVRAAGPAMDQWEVHVGAMNKLVVGAISLTQATAFWNQTRVGARNLIADFHQAEKTPAQQDVSCPLRHLGHHPSPALRTCARQVAANARALAASRTAVSTWEMHVQDMEALRAGKLSPADATSMWLSMWKQGVHELRMFHAAERTAARQGGCQAG
jgi:hypothetical protein